jgi:hypothetical protein
MPAPVFLEVNMSQEDFNELLEIFRKLKQWRDEKDAAEQEALIRSGAPLVNQEHPRVH